MGRRATCPAGLHGEVTGGDRAGRVGDSVLTNLQQEEDQDQYTCNTNDNSAPIRPRRVPPWWFLEWLLVL